MGAKLVGAGVTETERCIETFDDKDGVFRCSKKQGHFGKHHCVDNLVSVAWTDAGKRRVLQERAAKQAEVAQPGEFAVAVGSKRSRSSGSSEPERA